MKDSTPRNLLISGGPVHAHLDAVKIITNKFRGRLMAELADQLAGLVYPEKFEVTYLTSKHGALPSHSDVKVVFHDGFQDYRQKILQLAPYMAGIVLGAAVVNLIPKKPWPDKFPSHNYQPGDSIPIEFEIAPRVINAVRAVSPTTMLFGFKLLQRVTVDELVRAAYSVCLEARCNAVFANDAEDLQRIHAVTRERGVHTFARRDLAGWIYQLLYDDYYSTQLNISSVKPKLVHHSDGIHNFPGKLEELKQLISQFSNKFVRVEEGFVFGTVALRLPDNKGFLTTGRGKKELDSHVHVITVDHGSQQVYVSGSNKASLNAPLLHYLFTLNQQCHHIVHFHEQIPHLPTDEYAPPGTQRDSMRRQRTSFNIQGHGCVLLFDENGQQL
jgi:hypothetical protein